VTVRVIAITKSDVPRVAEFLGAHMGGGGSAREWADAIDVPWKVDAPNHGFMLVADNAVVGVYLAFYSEREIDGRVERFCNLGSWCVLPDFRRHSLRLLRALLSQPGYHFTDLSPSQQVGSLNARLGFKAVDTSGALVPAMPGPLWPRRVKVSSSPGVIEDTLAGHDLAIYQDHVGAAAALHFVLHTRGDSCYVILRKERIRRLPVASVLYVGNPALFGKAAGTLARHVLVHYHLLALFVESRLGGRRPRISVPVRLNSNRKMFKSSSLSSDQIDYLYSELTGVDW
jgi:hypothetical protein